MRALTLRDPAFVGQQFNPWSAAYPTPTHAVWAGDPLGGYADGVATTTLRNQSGGGDPTQAIAGNRAVYRAVVAALNNRAAWEFDGTTDFYDFNIADIAQPFQVLGVVKLAATGTARNWLGRGGSSTAHGVGVESSNAWRQNWGTLSSGGTANTAAHVQSTVANGASSTVDVDGANVVASTSGTGALGRFVIGAGSDGVTQARFWSGHVAYVGLYPAAAVLTTLIADLRAHYGI